MGAIVVGISAAGLALYPLFEQGHLRFNYPSRASFPIQGIDVSHHQGPIDWPRVAAQGIDFAYIKATEGGDFSDPRFAENWRAAVAASVVPGAYHFFTFCRDAEDQARHLVRTLPKATVMLPPAIDVEFDGNCRVRRPSLEEIRVRLRRMLTIVETETGIRPVIYVPMDAYREFYRDDFPAYPLWIRNVFHTPWLERDQRWILWQYGNRGRLEGIDGPVDLNVFAGSVEEWTQFIRPPESMRSSRHSLMPVP